MDFVILVAGSKDSSGYCEIDSSGIAQTTNYKQSVAKKNCVALIGRDGSSFSGISTHQGDYLAVAQAEKPAVVLYQRGKSSPLYQCPMQEIVNCLTTDTTGTYLYSGTRKGYIYIHDLRTGELITTWQAHLKGISKLLLSGDGQFLVSVGDDGLGRCWNIPTIVDSALTNQHGLLKVNKSNDNRLLTPFRSWNAHTLPVTDVCLIEFGSCLRAITCSIDRTVHFYDILNQSSLARVTLPSDSASPLECITVTNGLEYVLTGSSTGKVFEIDISVVAAGVSAVQHADIVGGVSSHRRPAVSSNPTASSTGIHVVDAHSLAVSAILVLPDNERFVTGSLDGYVKFYQLFTRQLLAECTPLLQRGPITNLLWMYRAESSSLSIVKPTIATVAPLKKYVDSAGTSSAAGVAAAAAAASTASNTVNNFHPTVNVAERLAAVVGQAHLQGLTQGSVVLGPTYLGVTSNTVFHQQELSLQSLRNYGEIVDTGHSTAIENENDVNTNNDGAASKESGISGEEEFIRLPEKVSLLKKTNTVAVTVVNEKKHYEKESEDEESEEQEDDQEEEEDIMRFDEENESEDEDDEEDNDSDEDGDEEDHIADQLKEKDAEIESLKMEAQRWKTLCGEMKHIIEETKQSSGNKRSREEPTPQSKSNKNMSSKIQQEHHQQSKKQKKLGN